MKSYLNYKGNIIPWKNVVAICPHGIEKDTIVVHLENRDCIFIKSNREDINNIQKDYCRYLDSKEKGEM